MSPQNKSFTITKKIAKHGSQAIICIPEILKDKLKPGMLIEVKIEIIGK
ncbi:MAG TPA: hypothetical protein VJ438_02930 [Candidatus Nanoarchaeia archaeon]|nr:hypothetical protein [Candidatus Nanoarchaeia archaeon]